GPCTCRSEAGCRARLAQARDARLPGADLVEDAFLHRRPARAADVERDECESAMRVEVQHVADGHAVLFHPAYEEHARCDFLGGNALGALLPFLRAAERGPRHAGIALVVRLELESGLVANHDGLADEAQVFFLCIDTDA